ncbi:uncharacterized protein LOC62_06G008157 [Vanrija pseudolonga]|uniref:Kinetochore protein Spc24 n=1 Tax=Vanrija pseudolonga TaxID=143232 RepID=A0AAF0YJD4_9TREE|nr:hypothetical protein LOC62_06G008157 [Vanrija pseudolonga]
MAALQEESLEGNVSTEYLSGAALSSVLRDVGATLTPEDELEDIAKAEAAVNAKDNERKAVVDKLQDDLNALIHKLQAATAAAQRPEGQPSAQEHEIHVRQLEQQQYASHKALRDEQEGVTKRESELARTRAERDKVRAWDVGAGAGNAGQVVRLELFKGLGFSMLGDKILVRNDAKPDVNVVALDDGVGRVHRANALWAMAGE